ncbi:MAG: flagellar FlbD family protein [Chloroflexi bacterium]|nr:flagellar FlbD family protein [Chloroflexota bacterium]
MIYVTRMDGKALLINPELLEMAEATPDTVLTFTNGKKMVVKEGLDELRDRVIGYRRAILWLVREEISQG